MFDGRDLYLYSYPHELAAPVDVVLHVLAERYTVDADVLVLPEAGLTNGVLLFDRGFHDRVQVLLVVVAGESDLESTHCPS